MYRIIGADQREYGPISADQVRAWIAQARLNARTLARLEESVGWKPLSDFPEFAQALMQTGAVPPAVVSTTPAPVPRSSNMPMASLILGSVSFVCCPILSIVGLVLGLVALGESGKDPAKQGRGLAVAGIAVSIASMLRSEERRVGKECRCRWST